MQKQCPACLRTLDYSEYHICRGSPTGRQSLCKPCQIAAVERTRNPDRVREYAAIYAKENPEKKRKWAEDNHDRIMEYRRRAQLRYAESGYIKRREQYLADRDHILAIRKKYYYSHLEQIRARQKLYYQKYKDAMLARQKAWRERRKP